MEWGVKANMSKPHRFIRLGSLVWVANTNQGSGGENLEVIARSRSGRLVRAWVACKYLVNLRAAWVPEHLRDDCAWWATREAAQAWAGTCSGYWLAPRESSPVDSPL